MKPRSFATLFEEAERHEDYWVAGAILAFTESLVRKMERQGMTRTELARRLGTTPAYVTKILRGKVNFTLATMVRLARALDSELCVQLAEDAVHSSHRPKGPQATKIPITEKRLAARKVRLSVRKQAPAVTVP